MFRGITIWGASGLMALLVAMSVQPAIAGCEKSCSGCKDPCKTPACADHNIPGTKKVCIGTPEVEKSTTTEFDVECKDVCIPRVRFPWQKDCCEPRCGRVRTVKVLKMVEKEKEDCGYKWDILTVLKPCKHKKHHKESCGSCESGCDVCPAPCEADAFYEVIEGGAQVAPATEMPMVPVSGTVR